MGLSPRSRRGGDIESGSPSEHELISRQRTSHATSPRSSNHSSASSRHVQTAFFPSASPVPSSWYRRLCSSAMVAALATACVCTVAFCLLHLYLIEQMDISALTIVPPLASYPQYLSHSILHAASTRQKRLLSTVESCRRQHPSYPDPTSTSSLPPRHTGRARPFPPLPAECVGHLNLSVHEHSQLQLVQLTHRMHASDDELDFFDPLANRLTDEDGPAIPYTPLPSSWLHLAAWDTGPADSGSIGRPGGDCELLQLGERQYAHRQSIYAVTDATALVDPQNKHRTNITTTSQNASTNIKACSPTSGQLGQEQDTLTLATATSLPHANASYSPRPPVTYLLSRHNSANPWHALIEHIYPQWLQMFLRGDFPYTFQQLTTAFTGPSTDAASSTAAVAQPHFDFFVYHETGGPNGPVLDQWWHTLLGAPIRYLHGGDSVSCSLCIFGPPKAMAPYDYWGGSRFVYDSATQFTVRLFRRHVYARVDVVPWRRRADDTPPVTYSFQRRATTYWRPRAERAGQAVKVEYVLPDFPRLLESERIAEESRRGGNVSMTELTPSAFDFSPLADPSRSILITANGSLQGWPEDGWQRYTALSSLPLVVLTRRHVNHARTLRPFSKFLSFYNQSAILSTLPYHLLLVYIEDLPLVDQVALLSSASVLLTVEGASEINQLYLPLRSVVIEVECDRRFYDGNRPRPWHQSLGQYLGHLFVQWNVEGCDNWDDAKAVRLHELLVRVLESTERNRYVYMS